MLGVPQQPKKNPVKDPSTDSGEVSKLANSKNGEILAENVASSKSSLFDINSRGGKARVGLGGVFILFILTLFIVLSMGGDGAKKNTNINTLPSDNDTNNQPTNNNSEGYVQSPNGQFSDLMLDLSFSQPTMIKSQDYEANIGQQISWQNGFAILAASIDRDYRPSSEFTYKQVAETGFEIVRVNFVVGNATNSSIPIGYDDLALYSVTDAGVRSESERFSEDVYAPKNGQLLGGKQMQKISLHYKVKRGEHFNITRTVTIDQKKANKSKGEEKFPVLNLKINLP